MEQHKGKALIDERMAALLEALAAPFEYEEVKFKPAVVSGNRALALAYVDARVIQDRLDDVLGAPNWQDEYEFLDDGSVVCRLRLRLGAEWITKMDVGGPSEQPDEGDRRKAAVSDALKRAAVKFGIGRYLYRLPQQWVDYDPQRKQLKNKPHLPASALPAKPRPASEALTEKAAEKAAEKPASKSVASKSREVVGTGTETNGKLPATGLELLQRLSQKDKQLAAQGVCREGDLVRHVVAAGVKAGYEADMVTWTTPAIQLAVGETRAFEARVRQPDVHKEVA